MYKGIVEQEPGQGWRKLKGKEDGKWEDERKNGKFTSFLCKNFLINVLAQTK